MVSRKFYLHGSTALFDGCCYRPDMYLYWRLQRSGKRHAMVTMVERGERSKVISFKAAFLEYILVVIRTLNDAFA